VPNSHQTKLATDQTRNRPNSQQTKLATEQ
jgi:hypothetical protein